MRGKTNKPMRSLGSHEKTNRYLFPTVVPLPEPNVPKSAAVAEE